MTRLFRVLSPALLGLVLLTPGADAQTRGHFKKLDVPFVVTPPDAVKAMLTLAKVGPDDTVYDLGSGDGRIVIAAVRDFAAKAGVGVDIDPERVKEGSENAKKAGVADRTRFVHGDAFKYDFREATVLAMFMTPRILTELLPRMRLLLKPGARIVSYRFAIGGWTPDKVIQQDGVDIYLWVMKASDKATE